MRYIAVERQALRSLLFDNETLSDLLLTSFTARREMLQRRAGLGPEVIGPRSLRAHPGDGELPARQPLRLHDA